jgi:hypothetical protein
MKPCKTRLLIFLTVAGQLSSAMWGSRPVYYAHCHDHEQEIGASHCESTCDPTGCLAVLDHDHDHDERLAGPENPHRCHCHHFHARGDANRFERARVGELVRKQGGEPAALPGSSHADAFGLPQSFAACPDAIATAPPPQRLLAIQSVRLLV